MLRECSWKNEWTSNVVYFFNGPLEFLSQVLPLALGLLLQKSGIELTTASLVSMYIATMNLSGPIQRIMYSISDIQRSQTVKEKNIFIIGRILFRNIISDSRIF